MTETMLGMVLIWMIPVLALMIVLARLEFQLVRWQINQAKKLKNQAAVTKKKIEMEYNKIATMSPKDLDEYLTRIMSMIIQITITTDIAENDPDAAAILYGNLAIGIEKHLGPETVEAIEYFYGKDYITRWCELTYNFLDSGGELATMVRRAKNAVMQSNETEESPG